jgi:hypothetical protein
MPDPRPDCSSASIFPRPGRSSASMFPGRPGRSLKAALRAGTALNAAGDRSREQWPHHGLRHGQARVRVERAEAEPAQASRSPGQPRQSALSAACFEPNAHPTPLARFHNGSLVTCPPGHLGRARRNSNRERADRGRAGPGRAGPGQAAAQGLGRGCRHRSSQKAITDERSTADGAAGGPPRGPGRVRPGPHRPGRPRIRSGGRGVRRSSCRRCRRRAGVGGAGAGRGGGRRSTRPENGEK